MTKLRNRDVFVGDSPLGVPRAESGGGMVERDGERFYRISNYHTMPPFFLSVVSGSDHWLFVSSTGGLTCGRREPVNALFPYTTDDKVHDASETTGPKSVFLVSRDERTALWRPFQTGPLVYDVERNLYKNVVGNKLVFEEVNRDLGLAFAYTWTTGDRFGFIRKAHLRNTAETEVRVELLDGLRNLLPYGVDLAAQASLSTLVDAYKQAESVQDACAGIFSLSSILTDRAEPSEALKATVVWSTGLDRPKLLLSEDQLRAFADGREIRHETVSKGKRGAFFVHSVLTLPPHGERGWSLIADVEQGPAQAADLIHAIRQGVSDDELARDIAAGAARLKQLTGGADGFQKSSDELSSGRHFSNTLCNIMRGGVFPYAYRFPREDFLNFVAEWNRPLRDIVTTELDAFDGPLTLESLRELADRSGNEDFARIVREYLPLTFSRRHGDPSRPWNHFSIDLARSNGSEYLYYQGNWRDIFQNWEALALSFPDYIESFIAKFVNASTPDGHNPYRISREGIDWEVLETETSWSNIGYWGDHQVGYLLRFLELSRSYHPGALAESLSRENCVYGDVPYRLKPHRELLQDPRKTVVYDYDCADSAARRTAELGADGKLVALADGSIYRVNLLEKLLLAGIARFCNLVPDGGIWMNTQRPEWNDANNALVGYGLSMVTLCYLRRYLRTLDELLRETDARGFEVSHELVRLFQDVKAVLADHPSLQEGPVGPQTRKSFMDAMGQANDRYRAAVYDGFAGKKSTLTTAELRGFIEQAQEVLDRSIESARRDDGLFHSYNLIEFGADGYTVEPLDEMLEGQVAVLSSGYLTSDGALILLEALRASRLYREDQNSYILYPNRTLPTFFEKNVIPSERVERFEWLRRELDAGRTDYVERDVHGRVHFNGRFRNADVLRTTLEQDPDVSPQNVESLCEIYESVFCHRKFTGRSGSMYKYEGLGSIYWHMVSKLLLATAETMEAALDDGADASTIERLGKRFREIQAGIGVHKRPSEYGAFPSDPYSHTPAFSGVQQPGLTGQVKEDVITRFRQLGVRVEQGEIAFEPMMLGRDEFLAEPSAWSYSAGGPELTEELPAGTLGFTLCGVPVIYRIAESGCVRVFLQDGESAEIEGNRLGSDFSRSLFRRERRIAKLVVDLPEAKLAVR